jgi:hypothetical protein
MQVDPLPSRHILQRDDDRNSKPGFALGSHMTASLSSTYKAVLEAAERGELIAIETDEETYGVTILCSVSIDAFKVTPLAWTYGADSRPSELVTFGNDDDKLVESLCTSALLSIPETLSVGGGEVIEWVYRAAPIPSKAAQRGGGDA